MKLLIALFVFAAVASGFEHKNEYIDMPGIEKEDYSSPLPHTYLNNDDLPKEFAWGNVGGINYLTKMMNQHIPQYCGSCWAQGSLSALGDRVKIARKAAATDQLLSVQHMLNCGSAGSCNGGSHTAAYSWIKKNGYVVLETCQPYMSCSHGMTDGICGGESWKCEKDSICRTCSGVGQCSEIDFFPNVTVAEHGTVKGEQNMMAEIYARGPIACGLNAIPLLDYTGGVLDSKKHGFTDHIISLVGWGYDEEIQKSYWIGRNSWGEYWGEMGFFRVVKGENQLNVEGECAWATPGSWTEHNFPCYVDGSNCRAKATHSEHYIDPSQRPAELRTRPGGFL